MDKHRPVSLPVARNRSPTPRRGSWPASPDPGPERRLLGSDLNPARGAGCARSANARPRRGPGGPAAALWWRPDGGPWPPPASLGSPKPDRPPARGGCRLGDSRASWQELSHKGGGCALPSPFPGQGCRRSSVAPLLGVGAFFFWGGGVRGGKWEATPCFS